MEKAIKKAIEGGYAIEAGYRQERTVGDRDRFACLDPLFWQALQKAGIRIAWQNNWHSFIDHIASGGDYNKFFNDLLK